jgi:hypothetical protein
MEKEEDFNPHGDDSENISEEKDRDSCPGNQIDVKDKIIMLTDLVEGAPSYSTTESQFQKSLEQAIRNVFSDKIEKMLFQVIQETVDREIGRIKDLIAGETGDEKK